MFKQHFYLNLHQCYKESIEFLNDLFLSYQAFQVLLIFQNITIIASLLPNLSESSFVTFLSIFAVNNIMIDISSQYSFMEQVIVSFIIVFLLFPFTSLIHMLYISNNKKVIKNRQYKEKCRLSNIITLIRVYLITFQYVCLPIISLFIFTINSFYIQVVVVILSILIIFTAHYHTLEIVSSQQKCKFALQNFPNKLIDIGIYGLILLLISFTEGNIVYISTIILTFFRLLLSFKLKFYPKKFQQSHRFYLIVSLTILSGIEIGYLFSNIEILLVILIILSILIFLQKQAIMNFNFDSQEQIYNQINNEEYDVRLEKHFNEAQQLQNIQKMMYNHGQYVKAFRDIIYLSQRNLHYRQYLLVQILKFKCYEWEINSRGTVSKVLNCKTVLNYELLMRTIICSSLQLSDKFIQIMKLMNLRQGLCDIFNAQVIKLIEILQDLKKELKELMNINQFSLEGKQIMQIFFKNLHNDYKFRQQIKHLCTKVTNQKEIQLKQFLYNVDTVVIFVNMLDEIGKISKTSKNLENLIGYKPHQLDGIEVDNLLVPEMRAVHTTHMVNFVNRYNKIAAINPKNLIFYAYNNQYQLQRLQIQYSFSMDNSTKFQLCGIINKLENQGEVIILNQYGNIQGWTKSFGEQFGLSHINPVSMGHYNFIWLLPCMIKYGSEDISTKTILFKPKNLCSQKLEYYPNEKEVLNYQQYCLSLFYKLFEDEIIDGFLVDIQIKNLTFFDGRANLKEIIVKRSFQITNFLIIKDKIQNFITFGQPQSNFNFAEMSYEVSFNFEVQQANKLKIKTVESNFTLDHQNSHLIRLKQLQIHQVEQKLQPQTFDKIQEQLQFQVKDNIILTKNESSFDNILYQQSQYIPKIRKNWYLLCILVLFVLTFNSLVIYFYTYLLNQKQSMDSLCHSIVNKNRALSIFIRSLYNINSTYISQFDNNKLIDNFTLLKTYQFQYKTYHNRSLIFNDYYLFNIHIPSILNRINNPNNSISNISIAQIKNNFNNIVYQWDFVFNQTLRNWQGQIATIHSHYRIFISIFIVATLITSFLFICLYTEHANRIIRYDAFFRFKNQDIDLKISQIQLLAKIIQKKAVLWLINKQVNEFIKEHDLRNLQMQTNYIKYSQPTHEFTQEVNENLKNVKSLKYLAYLGLFLITQVVFNCIFIIQNKSLIDNFQQIPNQLNLCSKLLISPSLTLASINNNISLEILGRYAQNVQQCSTASIITLPALVSYLLTVPCQNCTFLYPLLTTNYINFYNSLYQMAVLSRRIKESSVYNFTQMVYSADVVVDSIYKQMIWTNINPSLNSIQTYIISTIILFLFVGLVVKKINYQTGAMDIFLKFFRKQAIEDNKLMSNLLQTQTF